MRAADVTGLRVNPTVLTLECMEVNVGSTAGESVYYCRFKLTNQLANASLNDS